MNRNIKLPFGETYLELEVPEQNLQWVVSPKDASPLSDPEYEIRKALKNPVGMHGLKETIKEKGKNVVILVDDMTRSTPQKIILPVLLDELNKAGVQDSDITIIIALGTHRPMTEDEIANKVGQEIVRRVKIINHECSNMEKLVEIKNPNSKTPVFVNKTYYESDVSIAVGNIIPHMYAGWAGGAKMIQPGVCGTETTGETHYMASEDVHKILGNAENPVRHEIENVARLTGLTMIINTVLNSRHELVGVVAGDPVKAHRQGVRLAEQIYRIDIEGLCDIVIASAYPADLDFWQSIKAFNNCAMAVKEGGVLILAAADPEGIAPDHTDMVRLGTATRERAKNAYTSGEIKDKVALATYIAMDLNRRRAETILISQGILKTEAEHMGLKLMTDINAALEAAIGKMGLEAKIGVVTHGADIYFKVGEK